MLQRHRRDELWAISCYFNPGKYRRRLEVFHEFRARLAAPLVVAELSYDGRFDLRRNDAEILIQLDGGAVLWQKERLLNIAWQNVPAGCRKIAWLDCDVVFSSDDWIDAAVTLMDDYPLVMLFSTVGELHRFAQLGSLSLLDGCDVGHSIIHQMNQGQQVDGLLSNNMRLSRTHSGLAWAANRSVVEGLGFYDACIVGSGNRAMLCAALDRWDAALRYISMNERWADHYRRWANRFLARVGGQIGCLDTTLFHLWHGDLAKRRYAERHREFARYEFDPDRDIAIQSNGCWAWASEKEEMHEFLLRYFNERREDG
jgi:hypothetical protein